MTLRKALARSTPNPETGCREALGHPRGGAGVYLCIEAGGSEHILMLPDTESLITRNVCCRMSAEPPNVAWQPVRYTD